VNEIHSANSSRPLRPSELNLLEFMLLQSWVGKNLNERLARELVTDMLDGGMGSIRFIDLGGARARRYARTLAQAEYLDEDGIVVSLAISADQRDELFDIDFWKVDFSPLRRYPTPSELTHNPPQA
jgi:hypothetical protein